jgi:Baseplate J-like protein
MSLPKPNLDDRTFLQIAEELRAMIPSRSPEWTDHNVHDPGVTFIELFSWLAEMQHYRLNRVSDESYLRFFKLVGLKRGTRRPAEVTVSFAYDGNQAIFVPAGSRLTPTSVDDLPFETLEDLFISRFRLGDNAEPQSRSSLFDVITRTRGREINQTLAEDNIAGHYEAFGLRPAIGDSWTLAFTDWPIDVQEMKLSITLFEADLPEIVTPAEEPGFVPSVNLNWEFESSGVWAQLQLLADGTLGLSRSGDLIFENPRKQELQPSEEGPAKDKSKAPFKIRATITEGSYEIPPRISAIQTNAIRARQVETVVNEDLGQGLGTPNQTVRVRKAPVLLASDFDDRPFRAGEVLDWKVLLVRLANPSNFVSNPYASWVDLVSARLNQLNSNVAPFLNDRALTHPEAEGYNEKHRDATYIYPLTQAFKKLLQDPGFFDEKLSKAINLPRQLRNSSGVCKNNLGQITQRNRWLLRRIFPDLLVSDRLEIQTGKPVRQVEDEAKNWFSWISVPDFENSGPNDLHYVLDPETGAIRFGNGLNGKVPTITERIRARFYRYTRTDVGNVNARLNWSLQLPTSSNPSSKTKIIGTNFSPGEGGTLPESIEDGKFRSRKVFRTQERIVTAADYELQARQTPGLRVARAKAIANHNPGFPTVSYPGDVTVVVVPTALPGALEAGAEPVSPSKGFLATVRNFLNSRRLAGNNIHVVGPKWFVVSVSAKIFLKKGVVAAKVRQILEQSLNKFLDPYAGASVPGKGWPFGRAVYPSEIYQLLAKVAEVSYATAVAFNGGIPDQSLELPPHGLPYPGKHKFELTPFDGQTPAREQGPQKCAERAKSEKGSCCGHD